jgi:hypothetical protein
MIHIYHLQLFRIDPTRETIAEEVLLHHQLLLILHNLLTICEPFKPGLTPYRLAKDNGRMLLPTAIVLTPSFS